jgi:phosphoribosylanthranilate isomerase
MFVKICGITNGEEARAVARLNPDALGFVFWPRSRRFVEPEEVGSWDLPGDICKVGVFVDLPPADVAHTVEQAGLDVIQLHGNERVSEYVDLLADIQLERWKSVHLEPGRSVNPVAVDAFLVDSRTEEMPGGTGRVCNWADAAAFAANCGRRVVLAGGLTVDNVAEAIGCVSPWGVDVSSGVEDSTGKKSLSLVEEFILQCRRR